MGHVAGKETAADKARITDEHNHGVQCVYPDLADGVTLTTHATTWTLGTITEIVPDGALAYPFDLHEICIEDANTLDKTYQLNLYAGATDVLIGSVRFTSGSVKGGIPNGEMQTPIQPAGTRIRGRLAIQGGGGKTAKISIRCHPY